MADHFTYNRWHDSVSVLGQAVREMEIAPKTLQKQLAETIILLIEREGWLKQNEYSLKELGLNKIQGLHKSKTKRRWYDVDPTVHKAFNFIYMLEDQEKKEVGFKILLSLNAVKAFNSGKKLPILNVAEARKNLVENVFNKNYTELMKMVKIQQKQEAENFHHPMQTSAEQTPEEIEATVEVLNPNKMKIDSESDQNSDEAANKNKKEEPHRIRIF